MTLGSFESFQAASARPENPPGFVLGKGDIDAWRGAIKAFSARDSKVTVPDLQIFQSAEKSTNPNNPPKDAGPGAVKDSADAVPRGPGSDVKRDIEPRTIVLDSRQSPEQIARRALGASADNAQVLRYASEITDANGMHFVVNPRFQAGDTVRLPGHKADGTTIHLDYEGTKFTLRPDGSRRIEYKDKTGYEEKNESDGSNTKKFFGPAPSDHYTVKTDATGGIERIEGKPGAVKNLDFGNERAQLNALADAKIGLHKERADFKKDMEAFETRARAASMPPQEVAQTYREISRLLEAQGNQPLPERARVRLALGLLRNAAEPTSNDQGEYLTCNVTTIENRLNTREPSTVAKLVADVATTGKFIARDGTRVILDKESLNAHGEAANNGARGNNERHYASQIFQVTSVNIATVKGNEITDPPGNWRYVQRAPILDRGEKTIDYSKPNAEIASYAPSLAASLQAMAVIEQSLTGKKASQAYLDVETMGRGPGVNSFKSEQELGSKLAELKAKGEMPVVIGVRINNEIFARKRPRLAEPLSDGHVILITDYDAKTGMVKYDNQWGNKNDRIEKPVKLAEMYKAADFVPPAEWLTRIEKARPRMSEQQYAHTLISAMSQYERVWAGQEARSVPAETIVRDQGIAKFKALVSTLSPRMQQRVREAIQGGKTAESFQTP